MSRSAPTGLTARTAAVLAFIEDCIAVERHPPTMREICAHFGWTGTNAAAFHTGILIKRGFIAFEPRGIGDRRTPRGLRVLRSAPGVLFFVIERVSASGAA